ncbi:uncharacterized protein FIESC28_01816 [Fusarium coffeatum]|uniref:HNH nuclease domain-containing protein n=1 Tax=Fusarium coffeatum TaxID=231269 RepID=A0A366S7V4_9HYPO|nr:uncharacterized protein FIESC28_01816 [Fusarium coffeatum]RBR25379.1 hypothetical protein FIESC28_01816 [Fusarium coffeatum]
MATPMPQSLNTHPPVVPLQRIQGDPDEVAFRDKTVQSCVKQYGNAAPPLTHDDVMCIWSNPWCFSNLMAAPTMRMVIRMHKTYSSLFVTSPTDEASGVADDKRKLAEEELKNPNPKRSKKDNKQPGEPPAKEKQPEPKKGDGGRVTAAKNQASRRDNHMCSWQWTPDPDISHFFPYAATQDDESATKTADCFSITKARFGVATYDKYRHIIAKPGKLEVPSNMQALGKSMHFWEDRGYLSFKASKPDGSVNGIWFVVIELCWLPYLHHEPDVSATADLTNSSSNTVVHACRQLNDAHRLGYPPRDPPIGQGVMKAFFRDRTEIASGRSVKFQFKTKEEADFFTAMVNYHWFGMSILTFRGVTKGRKPGSGSGSGGGGGGGSNTRARASTVPTLPTSSSAPTLTVGRGRGPGTNSPRGPGGGHTPTGSIARGPGNDSPR